VTTYVLRNGELIERDLAPPITPTGPTSHFRMRFISDTMEPTLHMATGRMHTSKAKFRADTRASGCVEVGDQKGYGKRQFVPKLDKRQRVEDIKRAIHQLQNGR
jgi:hypothetical protein